MTEQKLTYVNCHKCGNEILSPIQITDLEHCNAKIEDHKFKCPNCGLDEWYRHEDLFNE